MTTLIDDVILLLVQQMDFQTMIHFMMTCSEYYDSSLLLQAASVVVAKQAELDLAWYANHAEYISPYYIECSLRMWYGICYFAIDGSCELLKVLRGHDRITESVTVKL